MQSGDGWADGEEGVAAMVKGAVEAVDIVARGANVLGVFGAFNSHCVVVMPTDVASEVFGNLRDAGRRNVVAAVERDIEAMRGRTPEVAESTLAASALELAWLLSNPFNSATSKAQAAKVLLETMEKLRELAGDAPSAGDALDMLAAARERRLGA